MSCLCGIIPPFIHKLYITLLTIPPFHSWYKWVDKYSLDREVVHVAYHFHHIHLTHVLQVRGWDFTELQVHLISVTSLLIAIKVRYPQMYELVNEESIASTLVRELCSNFTDVPGLLRLEKEMTETSLVGHLHKVTTMHQFALLFCKLHPVMDARPSLFDYLFSVARIQVENALTDPDLMSRYDPSLIAFAALVRQLDVESVVYERFIREVCPLIGFSEAEVFEAISDLQNCVHHLPRSEEFEAILAALNRPESPTGVDG